MKNYEKKAVENAIRWNDDGFNNRNKEICTDLLNFPHRDKLQVRHIEWLIQFMDVWETVEYSVKTKTEG